MKLPRRGRSALSLLAFLLSLAALLVWVALRAGPMSPIKVTSAQVSLASIQPALFGIGTVESRYLYKIGPTFAGRLDRLDVQVGDTVTAGQVLGEMDVVDLDQRMAAQRAAIRGAEAVQQQARSQLAFAQAEAGRYRSLSVANNISKAVLDAKLQELEVARAGLQSAAANLTRLQAEQQGLQAQRANLQLIAPVAGLVASRNADPGTTVVAGQSVIEVIDPASFWINTRFDQHSATGLEQGLDAQIRLRSRQGTSLAGQVLRVEPLADAVTEEILAKVRFVTLPSPLPPVGELAEVTVALPSLPASLAVPNGAIRVVGGEKGVWRLAGDKQTFVPVQTGRQDAGGLIQVTGDIRPGDRIVLYSEKPVSARSRLLVVTALAGRKDAP